MNCQAPRATLKTTHLCLSTGSWTVSHLCSPLRVCSIPPVSAAKVLPHVHLVELDQPKMKTLARGQQP